MRRRWRWRRRRRRSGKTGCICTRARSCFFFQKDRTSEKGHYKTAGCWTGLDSRIQTRHQRTLVTAGLRGETTLDGHAQSKNFIPICNNLQNLSKSLKEGVSLGAPKWNHYVQLCYLCKNLVHVRWMMDFTNRLKHILLKPQLTWEDVYRRSQDEDFCDVFLRCLIFQPWNESLPDEGLKSVVQISLNIHLCSIDCKCEKCERKICSCSCFWRNRSKNRSCLVERCWMSSEFVNFLQILFIHLAWLPSLAHSGAHSFLGVCYSARSVN